MRFVMLIKSDAKTEAGTLPDHELLSAMGKYNQELIDAKVLVAAEGLQASSKGARLRTAAGKITLIDGPFAEAKELIAGFWLIQVESKQAAIDWAKRVPGEVGEIEIRQIYELQDFPVDPKENPAGWREQEQSFRDAEVASASSQAKAAPVAKGHRFMVMLHSDKNTESGVLPDQSMLEKMGALMDETAKSGALVAGEGLKPSAQGARVIFAGKKRQVIDGPFTETKEMVAGYSIIRATTKDAAVAWAKRWLEIHVSGVKSQESVMEVRQVFDMEEFPVDPAEQPDGWRDREKRFRPSAGQSS
jgi:hypothetical protein